MGRVVHFEIHADNPERAVAFYQSLFGWEFKKWAGPMEYWLITTGKDSEPGINGGLVKRMGPPPTDGQAVNAYVCTVNVNAIDDTIARIGAAGCPIVLPKMAIPASAGWRTSRTRKATSSA
jgi:predicted enzyme related to lactoylglutathione lyase